MRKVYITPYLKSNFYTEMMKELQPMTCCKRSLIFRIVIVVVFGALAILGIVFVISSVSFRSTYRKQGLHANRPAKKVHHTPPQSDEDFLQKGNLALNDTEDANDVRVGNTTYTIELLMMVDVSIYLWWNRLHGGNHNLTMEAIRFKYAHIAAGMDRVYRRVKSASISIRHVGTHIATTPEECPWAIDNIRFNGSWDTHAPQHVVIQSTDYLLAVRPWILKKYGWNPDQVLVWTLYDIRANATDESDMIIGWSNRGSVCTMRGVTVEEDYGFGSWWIGAHELGHSLNLLHDGDEENHCDPKDQFIMTSSYDIFKESTYNNAIRLSPCADKLLGEFLRELDRKNESNCLHNDGMAPYDPSQYLRTLPGQIYSFMDQCKIARGANSKTCALVE
ncbi:A disintegrin and metalloproteinase with thrombospondin motifs adt-2-like isoform X2 [Lineus longissimus]|uniref:A disintegrin and metalloproteinase with thrombospondin motifs adt-2-like isoform X2 n=1 Tax=Lineus longissimus TaxID=88925 RepID=UPI00315CBAAF